MRNAWCPLLLAAGLALVTPRPIAAQAQPASGPALYERLCANCHDNGVGRAPNRLAFRDMPAERVVAALETGSMVTMANNRTAAERRAIAEFVTGKSLATPLVTTPAAKAMCQASPRFTVEGRRSGMAGGRTRRTPAISRTPVCPPATCRASS